ncbi:MAG TPA: HD domain-containing protein [Candidatus Paceibacterota bacterium]|nr:HD domain-containing protein [Candidatus Paceibacterota bacterium]
MKKNEVMPARRTRWTSLPCPQCGRKGPMLEILYGLRDAPPDSKKYVSGGCCIETWHDEICCGECGWGGTKEDLRALSVPPVVLTSRFLDAMNYANAQHSGQTRKATNIAYISHPFGVAALIIEARGDEDQAIGGLLHDVAEDCGGEVRLQEIKKKFGARVEAIVRGCSDSLTGSKEKKAPWRVRKEAHIAHLWNANDDVLLVTAADKTHNARAIVTDLDCIGPVLWNRFNATSDDIVWYYESVYDVLKDRGVTSVLLSPLMTSINAMKRHL